MQSTNHNRRHFINIAATTVVAASFMLFGNAASGKPKPVTKISEPPASNPFSRIRQVDAGLLNIGYADEGHADGPVVILLHGWPYDIHSFGEVVPILVSKGYRVIVPFLRGFGSTRFLSDKTMRNGQQSAMAADIIELMDALKIQQAVLAGFDWGGRAALIVAALWPERCKALVSVSGYTITNLKANIHPIEPKAEQGWWYQYYFATERGKTGYLRNCYDFNKLIWQNASPKWNFNENTFNRTAAAFTNTDHVSIVIHNYRWRLGIAQGEAKYNRMEKKLAEEPVIIVPAITIEGDANGAPHSDAKDYAGKFKGKYSHRVFRNIGHNVPQEAPWDFAQAVIDADGY